MDEEQISLGLSFKYINEEIQLTEIVPVRKFFWPSDLEKIEELKAGFWLTLSDQEDQIIYRRILFNPIRDFIEIFNQDPEIGIQRIKRESIEGSFRMRVPNLSTARTLTIWSSPLDEPNALAQPIQSFDLTDFNTISQEEK